jgi:hypothetical protein
MSVNGVNGMSRVDQPRRSPLSYEYRPGVQHPLWSGRCFGMLLLPFSCTAPLSFGERSRQAITADISSINRASAWVLAASQTLVPGQAPSRLVSSLRSW